MRKLLTDMLGPLGLPIDDNGGVVPNAATQPCLMDRLTTLKGRADVTKPPGLDNYHRTLEENARLWRTIMQDYLAHCAYPDDALKL